MSTRFRAVAVWVAGGALSVVTATAIVAVFGWLVYGSIHAVPALAAGRTVISDPSAVWAGDLHVGERKPVSFSLINLDSRPLAIIGMGANCTCVQVDQIPLEIPPRSTRSVRVWVSPLSSQAEMPFLQKINLYTSTEDCSISIIVRGKVLR